VGFNIRTAAEDGVSLMADRQSLHSRAGAMAVNTGQV
jgi:hypothetical protein